MFKEIEYRGGIFFFSVPVEFYRDGTLCALLLKYKMQYEYTGNVFTVVVVADIGGSIFYYKLLT